MNSFQAFHALDNMLATSLLESKLGTYACNLVFSFNNTLQTHFCCYKAGLKCHWRGQNLTKLFCNCLGSTFAAITRKLLLTTCFMKFIFLLLSINTTVLHLLFSKLKKMSQLEETKDTKQIKHNERYKCMKKKFLIKLSDELIIIGYCITAWHLYILIFCHNPPSYVNKQVLSCRWLTPVIRETDKALSEGVKNIYMHLHTER